MTPPAIPSADRKSIESEMQIMQAIVKNCIALGIGQDAANRMAVRSILNRRRAKPAA